MYAPLVGARTTVFAVVAFVTGAALATVWLVLATVRAAAEAGITVGKSAPAHSATKSAGMRKPNFLPDTTTPPRITTGHVPGGYQRQAVAYHLCAVPVFRSQII